MVELANRDVGSESVVKFRCLLTFGSRVNCRLSRDHVINGLIRLKYMLPSSSLF